MKIFKPRFHGDDDYLYPDFDGSNAYLKWNDGHLHLKTDEGTNTVTTVWIMGKGNAGATLNMYDGTSGN